MNSIAKHPCIKLPRLYLRQTLGSILLFCFIHSADGQYFSKHYSLYAGTNGYISSIQVVDDTIYAMCYVGDSLNPAISIAAFERFDKYGNLISCNPLTIPALNNILANQNTLIHTLDGGFAYGASIGVGSNQVGIVILKYDRIGNFQWYKEIVENASAFQCDVLIQDSLSNYYLTGTIQRTTGTDADMFLTKTNSSGNQIYTKQYFHPNFDDIGSGLYINKAGRIILGGGGLKYNIIDLSTAVDCMEVYELDTAGNLLNFTLGTDTNGPQANNVIQSNDGGYLVASSYYCYRDPHFLKWQGAISKLDSGYHEVWKIDLGPCSQHTYLYAQKSCSDGNYIAIGQSYDQADTPYTHMNGWILKYSGDGQVIWNKLYRGMSSNGLNGDDNNLGSMGFMSDGSIICAGQAENGDLLTTPQQQGWLLHLDTAGCIPDSNSCGTVNGLNEINQHKATVLVYPNPASNFVSISIEGNDIKEASYILTNAVGQSLHESKLERTTGILDLSHLPSAIYMLEVNVNGERIVKKLVKE